MTLKKILINLNPFKKKEVELSYPPEFAIIDYSRVAKLNGIEDEQNKLIYFYTFDRYGNRIVKKIPVS